MNTLKLKNSEAEFFADSDKENVLKN